MDIPGWIPGWWLLTQSDILLGNTAAVIPIMARVRIIENMKEMRYLKTLQHSPAYQGSFHAPSAMYSVTTWEYTFWTNARQEFLDI